jgi:hypothetical protein
MAETWAKRSDEAEKASIDLHLDLSGTRVRLGLETALRDAIRTGRLGPGTRLPSSRALAADLGLLALMGLESFRTPGTSDGRAGLVIGYGRPAEHAYTTALARLCAVLDPEVTGRAGEAAPATGRPGKSSTRGATREYASYTGDCISIPADCDPIWSIPARLSGYQPSRR